jgi:hypothetical protein
MSAALGSSSVRPNNGVSLIEDAEFRQHARAETAQVLKIENVDLSAVRGGPPPKIQRKVPSPRMEKISYGQNSC